MTITKQNNGQSSGRRYGLLSMLALIVGVVIGSGIFVKNEQLWNTTHSAFESMMGWFIIAILVVFMLIAFIEIASITRKTKEQGTLSNWSRHLWGKRASKFIAFFFPLVYFPMLISGLSIFSGDYLLRGIEETTGVINLGSLDQGWSTLIITTLISMGVLIFFYSMNALTNKPGKFVQTTGTFVKLIPLFAVIIVGATLIIDPSLSGNSSWDTTASDIFDTSSALNTGYEGGIDAFETVLLILPAIMFSFDGFLFAASLSNEAKKQSTFKVAAISGVTFIILIYIAVTFFMFLIGDPNSLQGMTVAGALQSQFPDQPWIYQTTTYIIFISIITGVSGNIISSQRMMAGLSYQDYVADKQGRLLTRNRTGAPVVSGFAMLGITAFWFLLMRVSDSLIYAQAINEGATNFTTYAMTGWGTDLTVIGSFSIYAFLIAGALRNRFTYNVYTEKQRFFVISSIIAIPMIILILVYFAIDIFAFEFNDAVEVTWSTLKISFIALFLLIPIVLIWITNRRSTKKPLTKKEYEEKQFHKYAYENLMTLDEAKESTKVAKNIFVKKTAPSKKPVMNNSQNRK